MAIESISNSGKFSSERAINDYCNNIWELKAVKVPKSTFNAKDRVDELLN
jgi:hypothetical protein